MQLSPARFSDAAVAVTAVDTVVVVVVVVVAAAAAGVYTVAVLVDVAAAVVVAAAAVDDTCTVVAAVATDGLDGVAVVALCLQRAVPAHAVVHKPSRTPRCARVIRTPHGHPSAQERRVGAREEKCAWKRYV